MRDLELICDNLIEARVFADRNEAANHVEGHPWAIQISERHPASSYAVLGVWRLGTAMAAVRLLTARPRDRRRLLAHLTDVLSEQGFASVVSPFLEQPATKPFRQAGFDLHERLIVFKKRGLDFRDIVRTCVAREMTAGDIDAIVDIDAASFDDLWRFRHGDVSALLSTARGFVAVREGNVIGYNMVSVSRDVGTVGRLAVHPEHRSTGVGSTLLAAGLSWLEKAGCAEVTLCTQSDNRASRELYRRFGFAQLPDELAIMKKDM